jgi:hypothetical protein
MNLVTKSIIFIVLLTVQGFAYAKDTWKGVDRIVAIGDLHGDYEQFREVLEMTGLVDIQGKWIGGRTHLVQNGDIPDRGPDSLKIIRHLQALEKSARKSKGYVHLLIGNHEAMNIYGDLRYVHDGEFSVLVNEESSQRQADYYQRFITHMASNDSEIITDEAFKDQWMTKYPLGYVEHRILWQPGGEVAEWVRKHNSVIRINDTLFAHGGINPHLPLQSIRQINKTAKKELSRTPLVEGALVESPDGPLWYRGLAQNPEATELQPMLAMLKFYDANRIVIAHTPTRGVINPRFDARAIVIDVGIAAHYGRGMAALLIEDGKYFAIHRGTRVALPSKDSQLIDYFSKILPLEPNPIYVERIIEQLKLLQSQPPPEPGAS